MLVINPRSLEKRLVFPVVDVLEDILESAIIFLEDSILSGQKLLSWSGGCMGNR